MFRKNVLPLTVRKLASQAVPVDFRLQNGCGTGGTVLWMCFKFSTPSKYASVKNGFVRKCETLNCPRLFIIMFQIEMNLNGTSKPTDPC